MKEQKEIIMKRFVRPRVYLFLAGVCLTLLTSAFLPSATSPAHAQSINQSTIMCGGQRHPPSAFTFHSSGGYVGTDWAGHPCDGSYSTVTTPTSAQVVWPYDTYFPLNGNSSLISFYAYIPSGLGNFANVDYQIFDCSGKQLLHVSNINQGVLGSGWLYLGSYTPLNPFQSRLCIGNVLLWSGQRANHEMVEDAFKITIS